MERSGKERREEESGTVGERIGDRESRGRIGDETVGG